MINLELAKKIKELRLKNMLTQEELANETNLSLRTIQRIESGETEPRGDTLKRLANVFAVTPNDLIEWVEQEDKVLLVFLNLSALSFIAFPLLGLIIPIAIWVFKRHQVKNVEETGKQLINFQITWCILIGLWYIFLFFAVIFDLKLSLPNFGNKSSYFGMGVSELILIGTIFLFYGYNVCFVIVNSIRSYHGKKIFYQPAIRFLK